MDEDEVKEAIKNLQCCDGKMNLELIEKLLKAFKMDNHLVIIAYAEIDEDEVTTYSYPIWSCLDAEVGKELMLNDIGRRFWDMFKLEEEDVQKFLDGIMHGYKDQRKRDEDMGIML